jgi:hypothetical protein
MKCRTVSGSLKKKWGGFLSHLALSSSNEYVNNYITGIHVLNPHTTELLARI